MNKMTEDSCRIGYTNSQAWILKVLRSFYSNPLQTHEEAYLLGNAHT